MFILCLFAISLVLLVHLSECFNILLRSWANAYSLVPGREGKTLAEIVEHLYETRVLARYRKHPEKIAAIEAFVEECSAQYG